MMHYWDEMNLSSCLEKERGQNVFLLPDPTLHSILRKPILSIASLYGLPICLTTHAVKVDIALVSHTRLLELK